jgi:osmotically inducible lipoprotein OsmB
MKRMLFTVTILVFVCTLGFGCAGMTNTQQKTLSGGAIGATGGAVLGAVVGGNPAVGAAVGGAAGAATGYIIGEHDRGRW